MNLTKKKVVKTDNKEVFLEHKRKKTWVDAKSGHKCFMFYARSLYIIWGTSRDQFWIWNSFKQSSDENFFDTNRQKYWTWNSFKYTSTVSDENIEVAKLNSVCFLDVSGKFKLSDLSPGTLYEVVYEVKLTKGAYGWEFPIKLRLSLPDGRVQERQVSLLYKPRGQWMELNVGNFCTEENGETEETKEVCFDLYEHGGHWKNGLVIRGAILRPKGKPLLEI